MLKKRTARIVRMPSHDLMRGVRREATDWIAELEQLTEEQLIRFVEEDPRKYRFDQFEMALARSLQKEAARMWLRKFGGGQ